MNTLAAANKAIANYFMRLDNAETASREAGCYGIIGRETVRGMLRGMLHEFTDLKSGNPVKIVTREKPTPRGRYVNKPEWNN